MANIDNVQLPDGSSYNIVDNTSGFATQNYVDSAVSSVTKTTIGLGNVDNTSDLNKPISTATQTALGTLDEDKADKTDIATVESGTTASRAYSVGELVYVSGTLYRVKTAIASGATFTVGTNIEVTNISNALKDKGSVSVTADGVKTYRVLLNELYAQMVSSKITPRSYLQVANVLYHSSVGKTIYSNSLTQASYLSVTTIELNPTASKMYSGAVRSNGLTVTDDSSTVPQSGLVITFIY